MTMIEKIARAMAEADCSGLRRHGINADIKHWRSFESEAMAALMAMLEPSEAMEKAAREYSKGAAIFAPTADISTLGIIGYRAAIRAAIDEKQS